MSQTKHEEISPQEAETPVNPDRRAFLGRSAVMAAALVASWLPARRALGIDPVTALRYD